MFLANTFPRLNERILIRSDNISLSPVIALIKFQHRIPFDNFLTTISLEILSLD